MFFHKKKKESKTVEQEEVKQKEEVKQEEPAPEVKTESVEETKEVKEEKQPEPQPVVEETPDEGNGIPLSDVALKSEVKLWIQEALSAMQAKVDSVEKENADLKDELAKAKSETDGLRSKYEDGDFGGEQKKGSVFSAKKTSVGREHVSYADMWGSSTTFDK